MNIYQMSRVINRPAGFCSLKEQSREDDGKDWDEAQ